MAQSVAHNPITKSPEWRALEQHFQEVRGFHMRSFFAGDPARGTDLTLEAAGVHLGPESTQ
ncbi:MAG: hypothetical protein M3024_13170 [Candidatus Dormibacteraeota bacterium]|nr:hypothetical protein [Candidatus Dormibacteraeota bacterium]